MARVRPAFPVAFWDTAGVHGDTNQKSIFFLSDSSEGLSVWKTGRPLDNNQTHQWRWRPPPAGSFCGTERTISLWHAQLRHLGLFCAFARMYTTRCPLTNTEGLSATLWKTTPDTSYSVGCSLSSSSGGDGWFSTPGGSFVLAGRVFVAFACRSCERRSKFIVSQHTLASYCSTVCFLDKLASHVLHNCVDTSQWLKPNKQSSEFLLRQRSEEIKNRRTKGATATTCQGLLFCTASRSFLLIMRCFWRPTLFLKLQQAVLLLSGATQIWRAIDLHGHDLYPTWGGLICARFPGLCWPVATLLFSNKALWLWQLWSRICEVSTEQFKKKMRLIGLFCRSSEHYNSFNEH